MNCKTFQWSHHPLSLGMSSVDLTRSSNMSDVTLLSHDLTPFNAHRIILSCCSGFFKTLFQSQFSAANMTVFVKDLYQAELQSILEFIYFGETTVSEEESERFILACKELEINLFCDSNSNDDEGEEEEESNFNRTGNPNDKSMDIEDEGVSPTETRPRRSSAATGANLIYHLQPNHDKKSCVICFNEPTGERGLNSEKNTSSLKVAEKSKDRIKTKKLSKKIKKRVVERKQNIDVEYEVESVLEKRILNGVTQYLVKWKNYEETTWEPWGNLLNIMDLIEEFERSSGEA